LVKSRALVDCFILNPDRLFRDLLPECLSQLESQMPSDPGRLGIALFRRAACHSVIEAMYTVRKG